MYLLNRHIQSALYTSNNCACRMIGSKVKLASEKEMRAQSTALIGDNLKSKLAPFTFPLKDGRHTVEIRNVPMAFTPNLWKKVEDMLDANDDSERR